MYRFTMILIATVFAAACRAEDNKPDPAAKQLAETLARMEQMDKEWKNGRATKEVKAAEKATQEKIEKPKKNEEDGDAAERREKAIAEAEKAAKKAAKEEEKARKKAREQAEKQYRDRDDGGARYADDRGSGRSRVHYNGHAVEEGRWTEIGGVTSSSGSSSSGIGGYSNQGSYGSSSIGVRATVIRLDGPPED